VIDGVAKKMANDFFAAFNEKLAGAPSAAAEDITVRSARRRRFTRRGGSPARCSSFCSSTWRSNPPH